MRTSAPRHGRRRLLALLAVVLASVVALLLLGAAHGRSGDEESSASGSIHTSQAEPMGSALPPALRSSDGKAIYVSPDGADGNPGTLKRPKRTIQSALNVVRPGQRILVRAGLYEEALVFERSGTLAAPVTLAAYPGERPVVRPQPTGKDTYPIQIRASFARVKGLVLEGASGTSSANVYVEDAASTVELRGNEIRNGQDQGIFTESGTSNVQIIGNIVHDNGAGLPGQHQSHGMYVDGTRHLVLNNVVYNQPHGFGIHVYPKNNGTIVAGNTVAYNALSGIVIAGSDVRDITVRNNIFAYNGHYGIEVSDDPVGSQVDTNLLYRNGFGEIRSASESVDFSGGNLTAAPRFVSGRDRNFRLTRTSAAIDRALASYSKRVDADGVIRPQGRAPDIGAFEWAKKT